MNEPRSAREALILEALGELDRVLTRTEEAKTAATDAAQRIEAAASNFDAAAGRYAAELGRLTDETKRAVTKHIERQVNTATTEALASHREAMQEAATLAFSDQLAPAVRDVARQVEALVGIAPDRLAWAKSTALLATGICIGAIVGWMARG